LVKVAPRKDSAVIALYEQSIRLEQLATALVIKSIATVKRATNDLSIISGLKKAIEEKRKEYTQPINDHLKAVNEAFKNFIEPLNNADKITRQKILDYRQEQERIRQEEERINQLRIEAAQAEMKLKGELTESIELIETQPEQPKHYYAEAGSLGSVMIRKWEIVDQNLVPEEYKMVDAVKIGKVVRAGIPSIPGIRIWKEETLRGTAKGG